MNPYLTNLSKEEKIERLITLLKEENPGYASLAEPADAAGKRRLLRTLMNVRWPGEISAEYQTLQDSLLQEESKERGIVSIKELPTAASLYPCTKIKNADRITLWQAISHACLPTPL